mmetsp:Transcript_97728/g.203930  ORF Transcript_97728/g.203930 Transcript_97728/m.203930 type:complete len:114 (+) Transcript_97728:295-636(+)
MPAMNSIRSLHGRVLGSPCAVSDVWFLIAAESGGLDPMLATQRWEAWTPPLALLYDVTAPLRQHAGIPRRRPANCPLATPPAISASPAASKKCSGMGLDGVGWDGASDVLWLS